MIRWILMPLAAYWLIGILLMLAGLWDNRSIRRVAQEIFLLGGVALCWPLFIGESIRWLLKRKREIVNG